MIDLLKVKLLASSDFEAAGLWNMEKMMAIDRAPVRMLMCKQNLQVTDKSVKVR
jgi:hypothetical protein